MGRGRGDGCGMDRVRRGRNIGEIFAERGAKFRRPIPEALVKHCRLVRADDPTICFLPFDPGVKNHGSNSGPSCAKSGRGYALPFRFFLPPAF